MLELTLKIVTPDGTVYDSLVDEVLVPTSTGQIAVLPNHIPMISRLVSGELIVKKDGTEHSMAVSTGLVEIRPNSVVYVLADTAERAEYIDEARAVAAKERAETLLRETQTMDDIAFAGLQAKIEKELARLNVARHSRAAGISITTPKSE